MAYPFAFLLTSLLILPAALGADVLGACSLLNCLDNCPPCDRYVLQSGESLKKFDYLQRGIRCMFRLEHDCNLILYDFSKDSKPQWNSTIGVNGDNLNCVLKMQTDGNLVLYDDDRNGANVLWQSFTADATISRNSSSFVLWDDCSIQVYRQPQWRFPTDN